MSIFNTTPYIQNNILSVYADREIINLSPEYQRQGDIWSLEKRQLLIDSIINRYDIPKLYFHKLEKSDVIKTGFEFAVVDGRQRLEAIFGFIGGDFGLPDDFKYLADSKIDAKGMRYEDLAKSYPKIKQKIDAYALPIMSIETDNLDLIEDLFSRLNEGYPLNSPEKRNAIGGDMAKSIAMLAKHEFFTKKVRFSDARYRYREVTARLMFIENNLQKKKVLDTKKQLLDQFVRVFRHGKKKETAQLTSEVGNILDVMYQIFNNKDTLLQAQSILPIYYLLIKQAKSNKKLNTLDRQALNKFNDTRNLNRITASIDITKANYELLEYDRMSQQGTNDASSIRERFRIASTYLKIGSDLLQ